MVSCKKCLYLAVPTRNVPTYLFSSVPTPRNTLLPFPESRSLASPHLRTTRLESKGTWLRDPSVAAGLKIAHSLLGDGAVLAYFLSLLSRSIIW